MKTNQERILFWIDIEFIHFCIAKYLQEQIDCNLYAIVDVNQNQKKFFQNQQLVKFKKIWHYLDNVSLDIKKPDLDYLLSFEKKYKINIWNQVYSERNFLSFNIYHKFTSNEILFILEQECKFFENILDEIKPNYLVIRMSDYHHLNLLAELCRAKNIEVLMLVGARFRNRFFIGSDEIKSDLQDNLQDEQNHQKSRCTIEELQNFINQHKPIRDPEISVGRKPIYSTYRIRKIIRYYLPWERYANDHYYTFENTKPRVLAKTFTLRMKRRYREAFMKKNFLQKIEDDNPFIYFPMHVEPERTLLIGAPYYTNQSAVIANVAKSLPSGYLLYVKDHPTMQTEYWRSVSYYKEIMSLPNVKLVDPFFPHDELLKKCSLVITVAGSAGLEAGFYKKPVILLADLNYAKYIPFVHVVKNLDDLQQKIHSVLSSDVNPLDLEKYVNIVERNSFELELQKLRLDFRNYYSGNILVDEEISSSNIKEFLYKHKTTFEKLASEHVKKIVRTRSKQQG